MKINTAVIAILMIAYIAQNTYAQQENTDQDSKAKAILDEVSAKAKTYNTIRADFSYDMVNKKENINETMNGKITIKGSKYRLDISGQEVICDGKTIWTWLKDAGEVQVNTPEDNPDAMSPNNIFTIYEKGFKFKFLKEEIQNGNTFQIINLYPIKANEKSYHTIILYVDKIKKQIASINIKGKEGNDYTYTIKKFESNIPVQDTAFTFIPSENPNVEVIDMR